MNAAELMLDDDDLPPVSHAGGRCKACGHFVDPTHDSVTCAFATAAERDDLRQVTAELFAAWAALNSKSTSAQASAFLVLRERARMLGVKVP